ncbi:MAG: hypothetical protein COS95_04380 [Ignavibacteriales bacterium CG07_land_8_20_14_0_80_59_12]|nr:MAG: hypothetical protein COS95_04380 [Ignavibacteriales bacterium CG07_land_8_20_14_0_80_59_12]
MKNHTYVIRGVDSVDTERNPGFALKDSTDGRILLAGHALPDELSHTVPATEGFKVFPGTLERRLRGKSWTIDSWDNRWFTGEERGGDLVFGGVYVAADVTGSTVRRNAWHTVEIRFGIMKSCTDMNGNSRCDPGEPYEVDTANVQTAQRAFFYSGYGSNRYLGSFWVPFTAWDVEASPPRQLAVVVRDVNENRQWDLGSGGYTFPDSLLESVWVLDHPYTDGTGFDPLSGGKDAMADSMRTSPGLWVLNLLEDLSSSVWRQPYSTACTIKLVPNRLISSRDSYTFNPTILMEPNNTTGIPSRLALAQNYPNPFNSRTVISFTVPECSRVALRVYNVLGQLVRTLTDGVRDPGVSIIAWDGKDNSGVQASSGVYFYRLETKSLISARKLVLLK